MDAFNLAQKTIGPRAMLGKLRFLLRDRKFWSCCDLVYSYTKRHDDRTLGQTKERVDNQAGKEARKRYVLVEELARNADDSKTLSNQMLNVFFAGRNTPAAALSTVFFCLARHPWVWRNIREEVKGTHPDELSFEKLKGLRYLQHLINEGTSNPDS